MMPTNWQNVIHTTIYLNLENDQHPASLRKKHIITCFAAVSFCIAALLFSMVATAQTTIIKKTILFKTGQFRLAPAELTALHTLIDSLQPGPDTHILVEGHTDNTGGKKINHLLSRKRALYIKNILVEAGVADSSVSLAYW